MKNPADLEDFKVCRCCCGCGVCSCRCDGLQGFESGILEVCKDSRGKGWRLVVFALSTLGVHG